MKRYYTILKLFTIIFFIGTSIAFAECPNIPVPKLDLKFIYGPVNYINDKSNSQFPQRPHSSVAGLTFSELSKTAQGDTVIAQDNKGNYCIYLSALYVEIGYPHIDVYIDKKYPSNSCNFRVIKDHENYHVRVQKEGLKFFENKIRQAYQIVLEKHQPLTAYTENEAQKMAENLVKDVEKQIQPLIKYIQKRLEEKNLAIDTQSAYKEEVKKCPQW